MNVLSMFLIYSTHGSPTKDGLVLFRNLMIHPLGWWNLDWKILRKQKTNKQKHGFLGFWLVEDLQICWFDEVLNKVFNVPVV